MGQGECDRARRWRELLASERDAAALYSRLPAVESGEPRQIFPGSGRPSCSAASPTTHRS
jgi:hypothetical protein